MILLRVPVVGYPNSESHQAKFVDNKPVDGQLCQECAGDSPTPNEYQHH